MSSYHSSSFSNKRRPGQRSSFNGRSRPNYSGGGRSGGGAKRGPAKQYIHPSKFVQVATISDEAPYQPTHRFADFAVNPLLKQNIASKGFETPTPIQDQTIPLALAGRDIIGIANTGTGKTAAFGIPILHQLMASQGDKVLVMAPTRELAEQISEDFRSIAKGSGLFGTLLIGGMGIGKQISELRSNPQIVIGTPGRIKDHLERGTLRLDRVNKVVLDEVDRMLDMGFINDITYILAQLPQERQSMFFSATMDSKVAQLIQTFSDNPASVMIKSTSSTESVNQDVVNYTGKTEQLDKLHNILIDPKVTKVIVFDETKRNVERLSKELVARGFAADAIHGGKSQGQRKRALDKFKANKATILVATDVAARGIDVSDVSHVINYSLPQSYDDYIHRIGRAGRAGQIGHALTFVSQ